MTTPPRYHPRHAFEAEGEDLPTLTCPPSAAGLGQFMTYFLAYHLPGLPLSLVYDSGTGPDDDGHPDGWVLDDDDVALDRVDISDHVEFTIEEVVYADAARDVLDYHGIDPEGADPWDTAYFVLYASPTVPGLLTGQYLVGTAEYEEPEFAEMAATWVHEHLTSVESAAPLLTAMATDGWQDRWLLDGTTEVWIGSADGDNVWVSDDEDEAREEAKVVVDERRLAFPWAWNWAMYPSDSIPDDALRAAGFTIARKYGERLVGIDGAGYSFRDAHYLPLAWEMAKRWKLVVQFDDGREVLPV
jgi:hypothetical protein